MNKMSLIRASIVIIYVNLRLKKNGILFYIINSYSYLPVKQMCDQTI